MIFVVNQRRTKEGEYIGRPSPLGNPFPLHDEEDREAVIKQYRGWILGLPEDSPQWAELRRLHRKHQDEGVLYLRCWCAPLTCHGDVIRRILEAMETVEILDQYGDGPGKQ
jgi:hypothetical protein